MDILATICHQHRKLIVDSGQRVAERLVVCAFTKLDCNGFQDQSAGIHRAIFTISHPHQVPLLAQQLVDIRRHCIGRTDRCFRADAPGLLRQVPPIDSHLEDPVERPADTNLRDAFGTVWEVTDLFLRLYLLRQERAMTCLDHRLMSGDGKQQLTGDTGRNRLRPDPIDLRHLPHEG